MRELLFGQRERIVFHSWCLRFSLIKPVPIGGGVSNNRVLRRGGRGRSDFFITVIYVSLKSITVPGQVIHIHKVDHPSFQCPFRIICDQGHPGLNEKRRADLDAIQ